MPVKYRKQAQKAVDQYQGTAWLLYAFAVLFFIPVLVKLISGDFFNMLLSAAAFVGMLIVAFWMSLGLKNKRQAIKDKRIFKQQVPMMFLSACTLGVVNGLAAWFLTGYGLFASIGLGAAASLGAMLWYGLDHVVPKSFSEIDDDEQKQVLINAEQAVINIRSSISQFSNAELTGHLQRIASTTQDILGHLTAHPKKINKAQRFLHHYLTATESVISRYGQTHDKVENKKLEQNFKQVLQNIESVFKKQHHKLIEQDVFDLDVDIEVLNTLLEKQGIK
ncbi:5-bromo-4-chloroindolyl phosphate hydrolysis family protein [Marinicella rhabdoformis]|uniref:5-bromo-4-chloroindolyl phosphate hydrolysis family protein n=1 Tax=Marinicella rhabdoformis TaxID=2580566 RepID=UPI0012AEBA7A|nr:5-bromo-4-chloroindolyl phosphate hydrolysis family protein [Marinicella rhabdoformis]